MNQQKLAAALGTFDGIHKGHLTVIESAVLNPYGYIPAVITFTSHPKAFFGVSPELIILNDEKKEILNKLGIDRTIFLDFDEIHDLTEEQFLNMLCEKYNIGMLCCGYNYRFGKNAAGDTEFLKHYGEKNNIYTKITPAVTVDDMNVSSTEIRQLIKAGDMPNTEKMLGRYFGFSASVIKGDLRGRNLGYPTINQLYPEYKIQPKFGVYVSRTIIDNKTYCSVSNIGIRPTFLVDKTLCETNIFDFCGDLYGNNISVELLKFIRPEQKFSSFEELISAIEKDKFCTLEYFG